MYPKCEIRTRNRITFRHIDLSINIKLVEATPFYIPLTDSCKTLYINNIYYSFIYLLVFHQKII